MPDLKKLSGAASIIGVGSTDYLALKQAGSSLPQLELATQAVRLALSDAGCALDDVDGLMTMNFPTDTLSLYLSMQDLRLTNDYTAGGRWVVPALQYASQSVASGVADVIVIVLALSRIASYAHSAAPGGNAAFEAMHAMGGPAAHSALMARRYSHEFGDCSDALCEIAISNRANAMLNPAAVFQQPISKEDYLGARWIAEPLRLFDYCMVNDGAVSLVIARSDADNARGIKLGGFASNSRQGSHYGAGDFYYAQSRAAAAELFAMADLTPADIDLLQIYDNYTPSVLFGLEGFGFTGRGEAVEFLTGGHIRRDGSLPLNTSGGHTSEAYMQGMNLVAEAVTQLRGEAGERQVKDVRTACYLCVTPMSGGCVLWK